MIRKGILICRLVLAAAILGPTMEAQAPAPPANQVPNVYSPPVTNIDPNQHPSLSAAQGNIVEAYEMIQAGQRANDGQLGGHAQKAKDFLSQADAELRLAADFADAEQPPPQMINVTGKWTIYANDVNDPGGSTKYVWINQNGNQLSGHFKGPHQSGGISGFVNDQHIEFSTETRDVLNFRGQIQGNTMSGQYGVHGQHAPWNAVRSD